MLAADAAVAVRILIWAVLREIGPLFAVIMLVMRSGTAMAAEFALMRERGESAGAAPLRHRRARLHRRADRRGDDRLEPGDHGRISRCSRWAAAF